MHAQLAPELAVRAPSKRGVARTSLLRRGRVTQEDRSMALSAGSLLTRALPALSVALAVHCAQAESCSPFVDVLSADRSVVLLSLSSCEVEPITALPDQAGSRAWRLAPQAQVRWHSALVQAERYSDLLAASLRLRPANAALFAGPLLLKISARLPAPAAWRWDDKRGELRYAPHPSEAAACKEPAADGTPPCRMRFVR
jgi:hypothetical protein